MEPGNMPTTAGHSGDSDSGERPYSALERLATSRTPRVLQAAGAAVVCVAFAYAALMLSRLEARADTLRVEIAALHDTVHASQVQLDSLTTALTTSRQALALSRQAIIAFHARDYETALELYDNALSTDPGNAYLQNLRAYTLFKMGLIPQAIAGERRSIAADSTYAWGYLDLARFLCAAHPPNLHDAQAAAHRATALRPELAQVMRGDGELQRVCQGQVP